MYRALHHLAVKILHINFYLFDSFTVPTVQSDGIGRPAGAEMVDAASKTLSMIVWVLVLLILIPVVIIVYKKFFHAINEGPVKADIPRDDRGDAEKLEAKGNYLGAAALCEKSGDIEKAAVLYEKGRDLNKAAELYISLEQMDKAAELFKRSGGSLRAAALYMKTKNYIEAAKIFKNKGDSLRAAQALEIFGNKVAAAREYSEAGQFEKAAWLMKSEGMYSEASRLLGEALKNSVVSEANLDKFYSYAAFLALAEERIKAAEVYKKIIAITPDYKNAAANLDSLYLGGKAPSSAASPKAAAAKPGAPVPPSDAAESKAPAPAIDDSIIDDIDEVYLEEGENAEPLKRETSLRNMLKSSRMEPKYSMRMWVQILKTVSKLHEENICYGTIAPENIFIDLENNIRVEPPQEKKVEYTAPEVLSGIPAAPHSDVYSMGVILFEMVTGSLANRDEKKPSEIKDDIPSWLDSLIVKCMDKSIIKRYKTLDEISAALVQLKSSM